MSLNSHYSSLVVCGDDNRGSTCGSDDKKTVEGDHRILQSCVVEKGKKTLSNCLSNSLEFSVLATWGTTNRGPPTPSKVWPCLQVYTHQELSLQRSLPPLLKSLAFILHSAMPAFITHPRVPFAPPSPRPEVWHETPLTVEFLWRKSLCGL